jgi:hypothetical protein
MELTAVRHFRKRRDFKRFVQMFEDEILQPFENARVQETVPFRLDPHRVTCGKDIDKLARIFPLAARDDLQRPPDRSSDGVPIRCEGRTDKTSILWQCGDGGAILVVDPYVQRVEIGLLAFRSGGLWDRDYVVLIEQPGHSHLGAAAAVFVAEGSECRVTCSPSLGERRIGGQWNALAARIGQHRCLR